MAEEQSRYPIKLSTLLEFLSCTFDRYPFDENKDSKYFNLLIHEFTDLDIEEELHQYHAWTLDQADDKKIYYRSRFRSWLKTARDFKTSSSGQSLWRGGGRRAQNRW